MESVAVTVNKFTLITTFFKYAENGGVMIEEMLKKIRESEARANEVREDGESEARKIRLDADANYSSAEEEIKKNARAKRESELTMAKTAAAENYAACVADAKAQGDKTVAAFENKAAALADELYGRVISGDF